NAWQAPEWALLEYGSNAAETDQTVRFHANMTTLDRGIGAALDAVEQAGVADRTLAFCISDNGAFDLGREGLDVGSNAPLRDGGVTCWEGGLRVPALVRWPGRVAAGSVIREACWSPDLL